jgi:hypothetical protein
MVYAMGSQEQVQVVLDLQAEGLIQGWISSSCHQRKPFYGWMELASALERARETELTPAQADGSLERAEKRV